MLYLIPYVLSGVLVVLGLSYIFQAGRWVMLSTYYVDNPERLFPVAIIMVAAGQAIAAGYDSWHGTWPIFVTAFGWAMSIKGALILLFPSWLGIIRRMNDGFFILYVRAGGVLLVILGVLLYRYIQ